MEFILGKSGQPGSIGVIIYLPNHAKTSTIQEVEALTMRAMAGICLLGVCDAPENMEPAGYHAPI